MTAEPLGLDLLGPVAEARPTAPELPGFVLRRPRVPFVPDYCVLAPAEDAPFAGGLAELLRAAELVARREATARFGDPECFSLLCNAGRTRRRRWPHVHIILAPSIRAKRWALLWLSLKHLSRPWRWPGLRRLWARAR